MTDSSPVDLFGPDWWDKVLAAWNASGCRHSLGGFGLSSFRVSDMDVERIWVYWDAEGNASRESAGATDVPTFSASRRDWLDFIDGRFTATAGVLRRRLHLEGSFRQVLPYTKAFNNLARVARPFV